MKKHLIGLLLSQLILISGKAYSQIPSLSVLLGAAKTQAKASAMRLAVEYSEKNMQNYLFIPPDSVIKGNWLFAVTPDINMETGEKDAFSSIVAKATGNFLNFKDTVIAGVPHVPNPLRAFSVFPVSAGIETDNTFKNGNALLEIGYVPWYQAAAKTPLALKKTKIAFFVQGGYKFKITEVGDSLVISGGNIDQSKETPNSSLFRIKGSCGYSLQWIFNKKSYYGFGLTGTADGWYDLINKAVYYRLKGSVRIILNKTKNFDFSYQKGSGAPIFNKGDQFSANLIIGF
jgi:hypothetical protein